MSKLIQHLVIASGLGEGDVRAILETAPSRYKTYTIPKRNGGVRIISQPAKEVKYLQRIFMEEILARAPIHSAATAYRKGLSIWDNANAHADSGAILKFDFKNFFPSIVASDWEIYCSRYRFLQDKEDVYWSARLLFCRKTYGSVLRLAIGAPSSPMLSNVLMAEFDTLVTDAVAKDRVTYTRYADDLTFSAKRAGNLVDVGRILRRIVNELKSPRLKINEEKTVLATKKYRRVVTGLVLSDDGSVSLGHDRKRKIRAAMHHFVSGKLNAEDTSHLLGMIAFVNAIEPDFITRLAAKYGHDAIEKLKGPVQSN